MRCIVSISEPSRIANSERISHCCSRRATSNRWKTIWCRPMGIAHFVPKYWTCYSKIIRVSFCLPHGICQMANVNWRCVRAWQFNQTFFLIFFLSFLDSKIFRCRKSESEKYWAFLQFGVFARWILQSIASEGPSYFDNGQKPFRVANETAAKRICQLHQRRQLCIWRSLRPFATGSGMLGFTIVFDPNSSLIYCRWHWTVERHVHHIRLKLKLCS